MQKKTMVFVLFLSSYHAATVMQISIVFRCRIFQLDKKSSREKPIERNNYREIVSTKCLFEIFRMIFNHEIETNIGISQCIYERK